MHIHMILLIAAISRSGAVGIALKQQPLHDTAKAATSYLGVRKELRKAEIIPTVIDDFLPSLTLAVSWEKDNADLGNTIKPKHLQKQPIVSLFDESESSLSTSESNYVVTLTDPDAPSRDNPEWSEVCHWIGANISVSEKKLYILPMSIFNTDAYRVTGGPDGVVEYKPPGPPKKTGKHRYVFLVFAPKNGTAASLNLSKPKARRHWGTGKERGGVRDWARENGLVPVAANFVYSQHKKQ